MRRGALRIHRREGRTAIQTLGHNAANVPRWPVFCPLNPVGQARDPKRASSAVVGIRVRHEHARGLHLVESTHFLLRLKDYLFHRLRDDRDDFFLSLDVLNDDVLWQFAQFASHEMGVQQQLAHLSRSHAALVHAGLEVDDPQPPFPNLYAVGSSAEARLSVIKSQLDPRERGKHLPWQLPLARRRPKTATAIVTRPHLSEVQAS